MTKLSRFSVFGNSLSGEIPTEVGLLPELLSFDAGSNLLTGTIPSEFGLLSNMNLLWLDNNLIGGVVPEALSEVDFTQVYLNSTLLEGSIPIGMCKNDVIITVDCAEVNCTCCTPSCI